MCYLCGGCTEYFPLVPTAGRGEVPRPRRKACKFPMSALESLVRIFCCIRYLLVLKRSSSGAGEAWSPQDALLFGALCSLLLAGLAKETPQTHVQGCWDAVSTPCLCVPGYFPGTPVFGVEELLGQRQRQCLRGSWRSEYTRERAGPTVFSMETQLALSC